jgi:Stealth protein CR2, conserved region 2/Stealth protein CR4, conserved region 4/Stealth protein CR3, conserved region 3
MIDVVYTWVDGAYEGYPALLERYGRTSHDLNPNRFRDNLDLLKYSLRSLSMYAPWTGRVFLVTQRPQVPPWLDQSHPALRVVHHDEFMPAAMLPTFNSFAIVSMLAHLPDVSERFLYLEDDRLLGAPITTADLWDSRDRVWLYPKLKRSQAPARRLVAGDSPWNQAVAQANHLLDERYGARARPEIKHAPVVFDRAAFATFESRFADALASTRSSRFRAQFNIAPEHMVPYFMLHEGMARGASLARSYRDTSYAALENSLALTLPQLRYLAWRKPKFYCLNDNFGTHPNPATVRHVRAFLERQYPTPSPFELR